MKEANNSRPKKTLHAALWRLRERERHSHRLIYWPEEMTMLLICPLLERAAQGALKPRKRQGEFEARLIVIHSDLALNPLGVKDIQEAGGTLAEAQLGNTKRFLRLL
jgi:hypothetical protein